MNLTSLFKQADLVAGNLEGAVGDTAIFPQKTSTLTFDIRRDDITMLREADFNIITIANNHSGDLGIQGIDQTADALAVNGIRPVGFDHSPQFFTVKDIVVSVVAINTVPGKDSISDHIPSVEAMQKLRLARTLSNVVIVSVHWGSELLEWPNKNQRTMARWLVENGADVVIGSHPHVVQQPELIEGKPVFFSLGNHLFDQKYPATKEGLIADIRIRRGKIHCSGIITHTTPNSFFPETAGKTEYGFTPTGVHELFCAGGYTFRPISLRHRKYNLRLQAYSNDRKVWITPPMPIVSLDRATFDDQQECLFVLEKHYSNMDDETGVRPYVYSIDNKGIRAMWRGSALTWPLVDAQILPGVPSTLCALHRGDSFININKTTDKRRIMAYQWNGFGFSGVADSMKCVDCNKRYKEFIED